MLHEIAHAAIQRLFKDKILLGLVIVGLLAIFVGGFGGGDDRAPTGKGPQEAPVASSEGNTPAAQPAGEVVEPQLAADFVTWWLPQSMDFAPQSAAASHTQAFGWMTPEAVQAFQSIFWNPHMAEGVSSGTISGSFHPTSVKAVAKNPDGSVVVTCSGTWMLNPGRQPVQYNFNVDLLVRKEKEGLRIAGIHNRTVAMATSSVY